MKNTQKLLLETKQKEEYTLFFLLFFFFYSFFFPKWFVQLLFTTDHLTCSSLWWQKTNQKLTGILKCDLYYTWSLNLQSKSLDSDLQLLLFPDVSKFSSARSTWILLSSKIGQKSSSRQKKKNPRKTQCTWTIQISIYSHFLITPAYLSSCKSLSHENACFTCVVFKYLTLKSDVFLNIFLVPIPRLIPRFALKLLESGPTFAKMDLFHLPRKWNLCLFF